MLFGTYIGWIQPAALLAFPILVIEGRRFTRWELVAAEIGDGGAPYNACGRQSLDSRYGTRCCKKRTSGDLRKPHFVLPLAYLVRFSYLSGVPSRISSEARLTISWPTTI